jgi:hypothetical protein
VKSEELLIAKTESRFRNVNERIAQTAERVGLAEAELVCECSDPNCGKRIEAPIDEYEETRSDGAQFLVAPGHENNEYEAVVKSRPGFRVVEKLRSVGAAARRLDPRSASA